MTIMVLGKGSQQLCAKLLALGHDAYFSDALEPSPRGMNECRILGDPAKALRYCWHCLWPGTRWKGLLFRTADRERHEITGPWDMVIAIPDAGLSDEIGSLLGELYPEEVEAWT